MNYHSLFKKISSLLNWIVIIVGFTVLNAWVFHQEGLKSLASDLITMKPNTAIAFICAGFSLLLTVHPTSKIARNAGQLLAAGVLLIGMLTLLEYLSGWDLHIDQIFFSDTTLPFPGRMAIASAITFLFLGSSLFFFNINFFMGLYQTLTVAVTTLALVALLGYLLDVSALYKMFPFISVALHTAICQMMIGLAIFFARPDKGLMRIITANSLGGVMVRRLFPIAIFLPITLGLLRIYGQKAGYYEVWFGVALTVSSSILIFSSLILWTGRSLDKSEVKRKRVEESHTQLAAIVESSEDAIIGKTLEGIMTSWNSGARRIYGYDATEILGKSISIIIPPERDGEMDVMLKKISNGEYVEHLETLRIRKDGVKINVSITVSPIKNAAGEIIGASAIGRDITERKSLEQQLLQSQKMDAIGRLAGGVAHDFNNLLTVIIGYSELALNSIKEQAPAGESVRQVVKAAERAAALTQQLLAFSHQQIIKPKILSLNALITDMEKLLRRLIGEDLELQVILEPELLKIEADSSQINQIIMNLAVNARDAMPDGGTLTIETQNLILDQDYADSHISIKPGSYVMLAVSDTGIGMDEITKSKIFEPFFTTKELGKGTGLGLSTVYGIVKQISGHIWVYSEPQKGTAFKIYISTSEETSEHITPLEVPVTVKGGNETILLVEDEAVVRELILQTLRSEGYRIFAAPNPKEAIRIFEQHREEINMIISDMVMPNMSGLDLIQQIQPAKYGIKILYISGYTDHTMIKRGVLTAETPFLQKPFNTSTLLNKVREVLDS